MVPVQASDAVAAFAIRAPSAAVPFSASRWLVTAGPADLASEADITTLQQRKVFRQAIKQEA